VEDGGKRQLPGTLRAADPWSAESIGAPEAAGGCALLGCQQAVAVWRVDRAQPTHRASGVRCTPWLGCALFIIKYDFSFVLTKCLVGCNKMLTIFHIEGS